MAVKAVFLEEQIKRFKELAKQIADLTPHLRKALPFYEASVKRNFREGGRPKKWKAKLDGTPSNLQGRTGLLVAGINGKVEGQTITITSPRIYSSIHHFGGKTKAHIIAPRHKKSLAFTIPGQTQTFINEDGEKAERDTFLLKKVKHPGSKIPARPFMIIPDDETDKGLLIIAESVVKKAGIQGDVK